MHICTEEITAILAVLPDPATVVMYLKLFVHKLAVRRMS